MFHSDDMDYNEDDDCYYCSSCSSDGHYFNNNHPPITSETFDVIRSRRRYGVELESSSAHVRKSQTVFNAVSDGSIEGPEFVSPILQGDEGFKHIKKLCNLNVEADESCGFHLHIDATDLTPARVAKIARAYKMIEGYLFEMVDPERRCNQYCRPIETNFRGVRDEASFLRAVYGTNDKGEAGAKYHHKRYEFFNSHSYFHRGTVEIRLHHGTFDADEIRDWINLNLDLFELCGDPSFHVSKNTAETLLAELVRRYPKTMEIIKDRLFLPCRERFSDSYPNLMRTDDLITYLEKSLKQTAVKAERAMVA